MEYILPAILVVSGAIICVMGASAFRSAPFFGGFLVGGFLGVYLGGLFLAAPSGLELFFPFILFGAGGLIGGAIAKPLYMVIAMISGSSLGVLLGIGFGFVFKLGGNPQALKGASLVTTPLDTLTIWLVIIFTIILAILSLVYDEMMLMVSTAFLGAAVVVVNLVQVSPKGIPLLENFVFLAFVWFLLGMGGLVTQNKSRD